MLSYLEAVAHGDLREAYKMTQLPALGSSSRGAALSEEHFAAFYEENPLEGYEIDKVVRFDAEGQDTLWEIEATLRFADRTQRQEYQVEGEVLGTITVQPVQLFVQVLDDDVPSVAVDGIDVDVSDVKARHAERTWQLLVLDGPHMATINGTTVVFSTSPPQVEDGAGRLVGDLDPIGDPLTLIMES